LARSKSKMVPHLPSVPATAQNPGSSATNEKRLRYFARHLNGGDAHEKGISNSGDGCHRWRNRCDRAG
jgi:hypothetical protein